MLPLVSAIQPALRRPRRRHAGFTLVELLVVLAIGAMLVALTPTAFSKLRSGAEYRAFLLTLATELRHARRVAQQTGQAQTVVFDLRQRTLTAGEATPVKLPDAVDVRVTVGTDFVSPTDAARFVFLPDGGSNGGRIDVLRAGGGVRYTVDWLSGQLDQAPLTP